VNNPYLLLRDEQTGKMKSRIQVRSAAQCAQLLLDLCKHSEAVLQYGCCVGELLSRDVNIVDARVFRHKATLRDRVRHDFAKRRHLRQGHDSCCQILGVPMTTVHQMLEGWGGSEIALFLEEIVETAVDQVLLGGWGSMTPREVLRYEIGRQLTVEPPADLVLRQPEHTQIPSTPAKSASSRRALTWLRNRAASAPSTMR